jgi:SAM-dependent methyltransferase
MSEGVLHRHRKIWKRKPVLRRLYEAWYQEMAGWLTPGRTVEVGGGSGNFKAFASGVCCTDVVPLPWLDVVADAQRLPFQAGSLANLVLFDALHHIENVSLFFDEAVRTLKAGGRIVIMDPYVSWTSWPIYRFLHSEPLDPTYDPLQPVVAHPGRNPFDSNQAISTILFEKRWNDFRARYPEFALQHFKRMAFFAYPLSGGFDHPSWLPGWAITPLLGLERILGGLGRPFAFRLLVVLERHAD